MGHLMFVGVVDEPLGFLLGVMSHKMFVEVCDIPLDVCGGE